MEEPLAVRPYKICLLTYKTLRENVEKVLEDFDDAEVDIILVDGLRESLLGDLELAIKDGAEVVVGGGANAQIAHNFSTVPVIHYQNSQIDILMEIKKGMTMSDRVAIVSYCTPLDEELRQYVDSIDIHITNIVYETDEELLEKIAAFPPDGVILGTAYPYDLALQFGRKALSIDPSPIKIRQSIYDAKMIAEKLRRQKEQLEFAQGIIRHSPIGILLTDKSGMVFDCNLMAEKHLLRASNEIRGAGLYEILPKEIAPLEDEDRRHAFAEVGGRQIACDTVRICENNGNYIGDVIFLQNRQDVDTHGYLTRESESGFTARMRFEDIVGESRAIRDAIENTRYFAKSDASVLLYGETGVGKELFAQSIHNASERQKGPFIAINCAAISESLLESELFGYDEGAFTGGRRGGRKGIFELASKGTIFLDEIGEISPSMQLKLLRVLQEHEIMRVGGDRIIRVDIRIICATNKNIEQMCGGSFRSDLFYRLSVLEYRLPPLREREDDVWILFCYFFSQKLDIVKYGIRLPQSLKKILSLYTWPGNIRELQNVCERFSLYIRDEQVFNEKFLRRCLVRAIGEYRLLGAILEPLHPVENHITSELVELLQFVFCYTKDQVADKLGVSRTTIWRLTRKSK